MIKKFLITGIACTVVGFVLSFFDPRCTTA